MNVLLATFDLFREVGGGQTFYRNLISQNPHIRFHYLTASENRSAIRPTNAIPIPFRPIHFRNGYHRHQNIPAPCLQAFLDASNIAHSVAGYHFDVVDVPDYTIAGVFLRPALNAYRVTHKAIAVSLHGRVSRSHWLDWPEHRNQQIENELPSVEQYEDWQFRTADIRYGISRSYIDELRATCSLPVQHFNPISLWISHRPKPPHISRIPPDINFIGRIERTKGPDRFIDLAWMIPQSRWSIARIIGPDYTLVSGTRASNALITIIQNRKVDVIMEPTASYKRLQELYTSRSVTVLPSRRDTLNLVALDSLFAGCPTVIGRSAGICAFLRDEFPHVPFHAVDPINIHQSLQVIEELLANYDDHRNKLYETLMDLNIQPTPLDIEPIYSSQTAHDEQVRDNIDALYQDITKSRLTSQPVSEIMRAHIPPRIKRVMRSGVNGVRNHFRHTITRDAITSLTADPISTRRLAGQINRTWTISSTIDKAVRSASEGKPITAESRETLRSNLQRVGSGRIPVMEALALYEAAHNQPLLAATYHLRMLRLQGSDRTGFTDGVCQILRAHGFTTEAEVAQAMFGSADSVVTETRCRDLLHRAHGKNRVLPHHPALEIIDDRRRAGFQPRVSIIVSLYQAADKLPRFLSAITNDTLLRQGAAELILVDSGSPTSERQVFDDLARRHPEMPVVYARSADRETIQAAWNRGITLSRAPYLAFLGVDEMVVPYCHETLAQTLDRNPSIDWVIANSIVTEVDAQGDHLRDIMVYDRTGLTDTMPYLETCYLSWVTGLYRRSIHDRFGYYDPSFRAAGDTEFKNRVLPWIKTAHIPQALGAFWNYPDGQTTASPRAEIEDLRAWYLHRTVAGIEYAFQNRSVSELEDLLLTALSYRKSYAQHRSTDVEYAVNVATVLRRRRPDSPVLPYADRASRVLAAYRKLDSTPWTSSRAALKQVLQTLAVAKCQQWEFARDRVQPVFNIYNDNRYEQHSWGW